MPLEDDGEYDEEKEMAQEAAEEVQEEEEERRLDLTDGHEDPNGGYTVEETLDSCYWCGTDTPDSDFEHRAVTLVLSE